MGEVCFQTVVHYQATGMNEEKAAAAEGYVSGSLTSKICHHRMAVLVEENIVTEKE